MLSDQERGASDRLVLNSVERLMEAGEEGSPTVLDRLGLVIFPFSLRIWKCKTLSEGCSKEQER